LDGNVAPKKKALAPDAEARFARRDHRSDSAEQENG
jgi:hypothetical protein